MVAEPRGRDSSMSSVSTESQYGLRHINGVPVWNGDILTLRDYETAALWFRAGLKPGEQERAVARLWANLQGPAKEVVGMCKPQDFEDARGVERLLRILRESKRSHRRPYRERAACFPRNDRGSPTCPKTPK